MTVFHALNLQSLSHSLSHSDSPPLSNPCLELDWIFHALDKLPLIVSPFPDTPMFGPSLSLASL
jgi:hypothetical protein